MSDAAAAAAQTAEERFADDAAGWAQRWVKEFKAARAWHSDWQEKGKAIVDRFLDKRTGENMPKSIDTRWNVYTASVQTKRAMLYGKVPTVDVRPRFADAPDSDARLACLIGERALNNDIESPQDGYTEALDLALLDRLNPGCAFARVRYQAHMEKVPGKPAIPSKEDGTGGAPEVPEYDKKAGEEAPVDYIHWQDVLWSPCRTFGEMRWCAIRAQLSREEAKKRFGDEVGEALPLNTKKETGQDSDAKKHDPWGRVDVWEIWDKENECVWFWVEGYKEVLKPKDLDDAEFNPNGSQKDPLQLDGFWPFPRPWLANLTTSAFLPRADFTLCQDLYDELDRVSTRINGLQRAIGAKGVYDKTSEALQRLLTEDTEGKMLPVDNWAAFSEKGGFKGAFDLMPLDGLIEALDRLSAYRQELTQAIYQITGDSDLSRGQQVENGTPGEAQVKARFASVRMQATQDEFARFASDIQRLRLEVMAKHFDAQTLVERSNVLHSFDMDPANPQESMASIQRAVELLKSDVSCYRVEVKPESLSMTDFAQLSSERTQVLGGLTTFVQMLMQLVQVVPQALPFGLKLGQWFMAGQRGAATIEGVFDQAIAHAEEAMAQQQAQPQPPPPDPKLQAQQAKTAGDIQKIQAQAQSEMVRQEHETQQLAVREQQAAQTNLQEEAAKLRMKHQAEVAKAALAPPKPLGAPGGAA